MSHAIPDEQQRRQALDPSRSFIVEAPAGSGKTELLMQRYLKLLSVVPQPECVVAMTFTRKAAAEMRERVAKALRDAHDKKQLESDYQRQTRDLAQAVLAHDREAGWNLLADQSRLQVQTIDALCATLTRQMPFLSGLGSNPTVIEEADELYRVAARLTLSELAEGDETQKAIFQHVAVHFDNDLGSLENEIVCMLGKRDQWHAVFSGRDALEMRSEIEDSLKAACERRLANAAALWPVELKDKLAPKADQVAQWHRRIDLYLTQKLQPRKKTQYEDLLLRSPRFVSALAACRREVPLELTDDQWMLVLNFLLLLRQAQENLRKVFSNRCQVDFTEIARAAIEALGPEDRPTDLAYRLDYRIEHLLVDEFQDTSLAQYELLKRLTSQWTPQDGRTLFVVGDPMQSIYRFRNAEVSLFLSAQREGIGPVTLTPLQLTANFRSTPAIVDWINRTFETVMCGEDDADYGGVALRRCVAAKDTKGPSPTVHAFLDDKNGDHEIERVVQIASKAMKQKQTAAILVRARMHVQSILPALRQAGIPYRAKDIDVLAGQQHILDIHSLTRAVLHSGDRIAWLACLRAPWCGLTLADLSAIAEGEPQRTILDLLSDPIRLRALSLDGHQRVDRVRPILTTAAGNFGRYTVRELVEACWYALGAPATLRQRHERDDVDVYLRLLDHFDEGGTIRDFSLLEERLEILYAQPSHAEKYAVDVMTVHGAKGLEFDVVILPQLHRQFSWADRELLLWNETLGADGSDEFIAAAMPQRGESDLLYKFVKSEVQRKEDYERTRLLYVSTTRARHELHLLGSSEITQKGTVRTPSSSALKMLWHVAAPVFEKLLSEQTVAREAEQLSLLLQTEAGVPLTRLPARFELPAVGPEYRGPEMLRRRVASEAPVSYDWVNDTLRRVGTLVHGYLNRIASEGLQHWPTEQLEAQRRRIEIELSGFGLLGEEREQATMRVMSALQNVLGSERGRWILGLHKDSKTEWALGGVSGRELVSGTIDRSFLDDKGRRWIIDYKTSEHEGTSLDKFLTNEQERYRLQMNHYAELLRPVERGEIMLGLYFPLLDAWREWQFAADLTLVADGEQR